MLPNAEMKCQSILESGVRGGAIISVLEAVKITVDFTVRWKLEGRVFKFQGPPVSPLFRLCR